MASRENEIRAVVAQLDDILAQLGSNVDALNGILTAVPDDGGEHQERLVQP